MTNWKVRYATEVLVVLAIVVLVAWDVYAEVAVGAGSYATISAVSIHFLWMHPAIGFALGGIVGHLTWPVKTARSLAFRIAAITSALVVIAAVDHWHLLGRMLPFIPFSVGIPFGHFLWGQSIDTERGVGL